MSKKKKRIRGKIEEPTVGEINAMLTVLSEWRGKLKDYKAAFFRIPSEELLTLSIREI